ncbi:hypothetical protein I302_107034 [Kwoniella bestiolae CBS 10118]|uniref:Probable RNA polymerase II nuclear localization protein SLC7A6OS n=1 Tax=Kwoniella bestiolae CBS 10118 TaxID=1296100 RepID=A0A1B9FZQ1_9TREE|nr:hypothetical protein I302_05701 [Kwoniella bestiolae CBS 10118]OCF24242.1 hypothetical protein I302_05701 [Kwoniella bestiolae CBS 10118]
MEYPQPPAGPSNPSYTVLRIKRKATEAPLSSLVIQDIEPRIRAKRRRDVSGRPRGVFRLAETVPDTWQGAGQEGEVLKTRIQDLISSSSQPDSPRSLPKSPLASSQIPQPPSQPPNRPTGPPSTDFSPPPLPSPSTTSAHTQSQYRVIPPLSPRTRAMLPPRIMTTAETEGRGNSPLVFVDAQAVPPSSAESSRNMKPTNLEEEKEMASFLPMLEEYLKLEEASKQPAPLPPPTSQEDEWVYDLYYRDNTSLPLGLGLGDGVSIGQLLGFEDISPPSSISGSEPEDEADEDSNDEDYYRNDYPEDEDADEDMQGFRGGGDLSDEWSEDGYEDEEGEEDRGEWGYR